MQVVQSGAPVRSSHWMRHSIAADVPRNAERIQISLVVTGAAAGWFGDLDLEIKPAEGAVAVSDADERRPKRKRPPRPWDVPPPSLPVGKRLQVGAPQIPISLVMTGEGAGFFGYLELSAG